MTVQFNCPLKRSAWCLEVTWVKAERPRECKEKLTAAGFAKDCLNAMMRTTSQAGLQCWVNIYIYIIYIYIVFTKASPMLGLSFSR